MTAREQDAGLWPAEKARRLNTICDCFERQCRAALRGGIRPRIEDALAQAPLHEQAELLHELLALEQEYRVVVTAPSRVLGLKAKGENDSVPRIPGYELLAELGRGGIGVVYKARQLGLERIVALKCVQRDHGSPAALSRFLGEAAVVARLRHPNIVTIHEVGEVDGSPYFAMEHCEGGSLAGLLAKALLSPADSARLVEQIAMAIQASHDAGVIHRDLKPANIVLDARIVGNGLHTLLSSDGIGIGTEGVPCARWMPKVTDFGLARVGGSNLTATETFLGTPNYMPPEQTYDARFVDARADVYALGAILYECLTGRPPFKAPTILETLRQVREREPVRPSLIEPGVPRELEPICLKCLEKIPQRRYQSASELAAELTRFRQGIPIADDPLSLP